MEAKANKTESIFSLPLLSENLVDQHAYHECPWEPVIRTDFLKLIYCGTLLSFPRSKVRSFWAKHPLSLGHKSFSDTELLNFFWNSSSNVPISYISEVLGDLEFALSSSNISADLFLRRLYDHVGSGSFLPTKKLLSISKHLIESFVRSIDLRTHLLRNLHEVNRYFAPDTPHSLNSLKEMDGLIRAVMILIPDRLFRNRYPGLDPFTWIVSTVKNAPANLGLEPFERVSMLSDNRHIDEILANGEDLQLIDSCFLINGEEYGQITSFTDFCKRNAIKPGHFGFETCSVLEITRDYICPVRKRTVLHKGCCYGAPVYFYSVSYKKSHQKKGFLQKAIENTQKEKQSWVELERMHQEAIKTEELCFVFDKKEQAISVNHKYLVKGIPARILSRMISQFVDGSRSAFSYSEFLHDREVITEPSNPNLAIRFSRIVSILDKKLPQFSLIKAGRGKLAVKTHCAIKFVER